MAFEYQFPDPATAEPDGLLAVGGDLSIESLIAAYSQGIFPWYDEFSPILWWSPDPRLILYPHKFHLTASLRRRINSQPFTLKIDTAFEKVIYHCAQIRRKGQKGTWITNEMMEAYIRLHHEGLAHSFETWQGNALAGGLYGVSLGKAFFGESMFHLVTDASKIALFGLVQWSMEHGFHFIDAQQSTAHMKSLGAEDIDRKTFLRMLKEALGHETLKGTWTVR